MHWRQFLAWIFSRHKDGSSASGFGTGQPLEIPDGEDFADGLDAAPEEPPTEARYPVDWEQWWQDKVSNDRVSDFRMGALQARLFKYKGSLTNIVNNSSLLQEIMEENGLRTVLCAGSGISREPARLANAGFDVTALDLSPTAIRLAMSLDEEDREKRAASGDAGPNSRGQIRYIVGDLFDTSVCPGPFDVVIERRTIHRISPERRATALESLAGRLGSVGILVSHCHDGQYSPKDRKFFHVSESWFQEQGWPIWDGVPTSSLQGRTAWLVQNA